MTNAVLASECFMRLHYQMGRCRALPRPPYCSRGPPQLYRRYDDRARGRTGPRAIEREIPSEPEIPTTTANEREIPTAATSQPEIPTANEREIPSERA